MAKPGEPRTAVIFNIQRFSTHDGPGIRTTIFLKGCPLSCWWCHNPESQNFRPDLLFYDDRCGHCGDCIAGCPEHNIAEVDGVVRTGADCSRCGKCIDLCVAEARRMAGRSVTVSQLMSEIEKDLVFYEESGGGVTLSGGEPASQAEVATELLLACRGRGIHTAIETCGLAAPEPFLRLAEASDLVMFDLKMVDSDAHRRYTGAGNERILANLEALLATGRPVVVRIPVVPGVNDSPADVGRFAEYLSSAGSPVVELLPFHRIGAEKYQRLGTAYKMAGAREPSMAEMARFQEALYRAGLRVQVGGQG